MVFQRTKVQFQCPHQDFKIICNYSSREPDTSNLSLHEPLRSYPYADTHNTNKSLGISLQCSRVTYKCTFCLQVKLAILIILLICEFSIVVKYDLINMPGHNGDQSVAINRQARHSTLSKDPFLKVGK